MVALQSGFAWIFGVAPQHILIEGLALFFGKFSAYGLIVFALWWAWSEPSFRLKLYKLSLLGLSVLLSRGIITEFIRHFFPIPRPFEALGFTPLTFADGFSFPSGHATFFFALALALWFLDRAWGIWYIGFAVLMGISRILLGVHWPLDIIGGALIGFFSAWVVHRIAPPMQAIKGENHPQDEEPVVV